METWDNCPSGKPGKDNSVARPIALVSNLCARLWREWFYYVKSCAMDSALCLESDIKKTHVNKEVLVGVFLDVWRKFMIC